MSNQDFINNYKKWKNAIHFNSKLVTVSFKCHVPSIHETIQKPYQRGSPEACVYPNIVPVVAYAIFAHQPVRVAAQAFFDTRWSNLFELSKWITARPAPNRHANSIDLFLWYFDTYVDTL